ncbi:alkaline phosphatase [Salegentibacter salinarum]|uniref:Alkaline phosphatase n=1 Tax=Salegentibacter salinarum TaxID=447422 RepID=A0A2N0U451_9FLAO|nr:alkaline phosphatase [Salegentibacter salinarum]PKD21658.1 alkaline phosphatase [Salegentibacter salinarum]SKB35274.1 alkaline phosphatase [Salegentibacter salinarum]
MKKIKINFSLLVLATTLWSCGNISEEKDSENKEKGNHQALNIILMVGDGMGIPQVSSAFYFGENTPNFKQFKTIGLSNTTSLSHLITDSASGGTAIATGEKTYKRAIGVSKDSLPLPSILENLQERNYKTGLVSLTSITHATPASFYAHVKDRDMHVEIAEQLVEANIDFFTGGGRKYFGTSKDGVSLFDKLIDKNYHLDTLELGSVDLSRKNAFILAEDGLPSKTQGRKDYLQTATQKGLDYFSKHEQPFFFMIEGSYIDWGGHAKDDEMMIQEVLDFDKTLGVVLDFIASHPNTLLVVTADHETGGVSIGKSYDEQQQEVPKKVQVYFNDDQHSAELVPVFAKGSQEQLFSGIYENNEIYHKLIQAINNHSYEK